MPITQKPDDTNSKEPHFTEGAYQGEFTAKVSIFGYQVKSIASMDINLTKKPEAGKNFDADVAINTTYVTPGFDRFFPKTTVKIKAEISVDESTQQVTAKGNIPFPFRGEVTKTVDVTKETNGTLRAQSSLGPFSLFGSIMKQAAPEASTNSPRIINGNK